MDRLIGNVNIIVSEVMRFIFVPDIGMMVTVSTNGSGDLGSIPGRVTSKTQKMLLDATLLNTHHNKSRIKGKVKQSSERSSTLSFISV